MIMYLKMAARNLRRHTRRSIITGLVIFTGTISMILIFSYSQSVEKALSNAVIRTITGNIQISNGDVGDIAQFSMKQPVFLDSIGSLENLMKKYNEIEIVSPRININCVLSTGESDTRASVIGIDPVLERKISSRLKIIEGNWLSGDDGILVCKSIADNLHLKLGQELVLLTFTPDGFFNGISLKIQGIVTAESMDLFLNDKVYISLSSARNLLYLEEDQAQSLVLTVKKGANENELIKKIERAFREMKIGARAYSWKSISGALYGIIMVNKIMPLMSLSVLMFIVTVGVINTVLMSVFERKREIGVLMAMGTKRHEVIKLFLLETGLLSIISAGIGVLLGVCVIFWLSHNGLPAVGALEMVFGGKFLYFILSWPSIILSFIFTVLLSVLAALCPAWKITYLDPAVVLRESE